jgi:alginate O-acetyltransferase complex protein AlgI
MNYNSWTFWVLFLVVFVPYWRISHKRQNSLLLVASYVFYGFWDYRFLFLILISTVIDYIGGLGVAGIRLPRVSLLRLAALLIVSSLLLTTHINYGQLWQGLAAGSSGTIFAALPHTAADFAVPFFTLLVTAGYGLVLPLWYRLPEQRRRVCFLAVSMIANLAILGFFKYCGFFLDSLNHLLSALGITAHLPVLHILLPAGISFYTFQAMSYTIDIYRRETEPTTDFRDFALFVCFFPHLVAGPIMRAHTLLPQVVKPRTLAPGAWEEGLLLIVMGMFKKLVVADNMAPLANAIFHQFGSGQSAGVHGWETLAGIYAFAFQIYGDFSGYSGVARGISKWLGFELVVNFRNPYLAVSPSDFWRRWHISLSSWLRDYLYIPLGGNRGGKGMLYRNLMLTMLLGGLWHGASWTFVAWGAYHGLILCVFRLANLTDPQATGSLAQRLYWLLRVVVMFHLTCLGWLLFRAETMTQATQMAARVVTDLSGFTAAIPALMFIAFHCSILFMLEWFTDGENRLGRITKAGWKLKAAVWIYLLFMLLIFSAEQALEFIYFQF